MIGYLEGRIIHRDVDGILLQAGAVGYEVFVNGITLEKIQQNADPDGIVSLYIYYHVAERQPKPTLIGFATPSDKEFFQLFISVSAIGPMKAIKAMVTSCAAIASAIENKDVGFLSKLPGIGKRTAEKIIATLHGKTISFVDGYSTDDAGEVEVVSSPRLNQEISDQVLSVLTQQLGHSVGSAKRLIQDALERNSNIQTPEALFDEIYRERP